MVEYKVTQGQEEKPTAGIHSGKQAQIDQVFLQSQNDRKNIVKLRRINEKSEMSTR